MKRASFILLAISVFLGGCASAPPPAPKSWEQDLSHIPEEPVNTHVSDQKHLDSSTSTNN